MMKDSCRNQEPLATRESLFLLYKISSSWLLYLYRLDGIMIIPLAHSRVHAFLSLIGRFDRSYTLVLC